MPRKKLDDSVAEANAVVLAATAEALGVPEAKAVAALAKAAPRKKGVDKLSQIADIAGKVFKKDSPLVEVDASSLTKSKPHLASGSTVLDYLIGGRPNRYGVAPCPGWPMGMISNIFGQESSGKTTVALTTAAHTCANGGQVVFIDWEHAISVDYAAAIGVPITDSTQFALYQPNTLEDGLKILYLAAKAGIELIILDSVGAGIPESIFNQSIEEQGSAGQVGLVARTWGVFLPKLMALASDSGSHVMGISQLRKKISTGGGGGPKGPDTTHQGGEAWKYYSAVRMDFRRVQSIKTKDYDALQHKNVERYTSAIIKARMIKSKVAGTQQAEAEFYITFGRGIDDVLSVLDIAIAHGVIHKAGAWYSWERGNGDTVKGQGKEDLRRLVLEASGGWDELKKKTVQAMGAGGSALSVAPVVEDDEDPLNMDEILGRKTPKGGDDADEGATDESDE